MSQAETTYASPQVPTQGIGTQPQRKWHSIFTTGYEGFTAGLTNRWTCMIFLLALIVGIFLPVNGLGIPMCTLKSTAGIPCPGCGLTRSVTSVLHGKFLLAAQYNPFGYIFAFLFAVLGPLAFLPAKARARMQGFLRPFDAKVFCTIMILGLCFVAFGIIRIFLVQMKAPGFEWWTSGRELPPAAIAGTPHGIGNK
ncbi:DUF2752 domain-containing protein [Candidatus Sumerlaeota bacterium]|nr:DUF2752 domain-containing protein [Candidatus Sumerlaeota bacterium]